MIYDERRQGELRGIVPSMPPSPAAPRPNRRREKLADSVASIIEGRILDGTISPGEHLPVEAALAAELSVSRTVVRDAIRALATRRLVDVRQGLGTIVTQPSSDGYAEAGLMLLLRSTCTIGDLWEAREFLDAELTAAAMRLGHADWSEAEAALEEYEDAIAQGRWDEVASTHYRFHVSLMTTIHNPVIDLLLGPMGRIITATSDAPAPAADGNSQEAWLVSLPTHRPILEAAMRGDEAEMRAAVGRHYAYTREPGFRAHREEALRDSAAAREALTLTRSAALLPRPGTNWAAKPAFDGPAATGPAPTP
jgi:GntR family transcriptional repressor for pyruvate dehydrogenase complex